MDYRILFRLEIIKRTPEFKAYREAHKDDEDCFMFPWYVALGLMSEARSAALLENYLLEKFWKDPAYTDRVDRFLEPVINPYNIDPWRIYHIERDLPDGPPIIEMWQPNAESLLEQANRQLKEKYYFPQKRKPRREKIPTKEEMRLMLLAYDLIESGIAKLQVAQRLFPEIGKANPTYDKEAKRRLEQVKRYHAKIKDLIDTFKGTKK
jgi:hypothetical protein